MLVKVFKNKITDHKIRISNRDEKVKTLGVYDFIDALIRRYIYVLKAVHNLTDDDIIVSSETYIDKDTGASHIIQTYTIPSLNQSDDITLQQFFGKKYTPHLPNEGGDDTPVIPDTPVTPDDPDEPIVPVDNVYVFSAPTTGFVVSHTTTSVQVSVTSLVNGNPCGIDMNATASTQNEIGATLNNNVQHNGQGTYILSFILPTNTSNYSRTSKWTIVQNILGDRDETPNEIEVTITQQGKPKEAKDYISVLTDPDGLEIKIVNSHPTTPIYVEYNVSLKHVRPDDPLLKSPAGDRILGKQDSDEIPNDGDNWASEEGSRSTTIEPNSYHSINYIGSIPLVLIRSASFA